MLFLRGRRIKEEKTVIVQVYSQKPRCAKRKNSSSHHWNNTIIGRDRIQPHGGPPVKGYNRKAELLRYSGRLRESAKSRQATPKKQPLEPVVPINCCPPSPKAVSIQKSPSFKNPPCLGNYKILTVKFLKPWICFNSNNEKKRKKTANVSSHNQFKKQEFTQSSGAKVPNAAVLQFQVQDRWLFFTKLLRKLRKQRKTLH